MKISSYFQTVPKDASSKQKALDGVDSGIGNKIDDVAAIGNQRSSSGSVMKVQNQVSSSSYQKEPSKDFSTEDSKEKETNGMGNSVIVIDDDEDSENDESDDVDCQHLPQHVTVEGLAKNCQKKDIITKTPPKGPVENEKEFINETKHHPEHHEAEAEAVQRC